MDPTDLGTQEKDWTMTVMRTFLFCVLAAGMLPAQNHMTITATQRYFNVVRSNLESSADVMPAEKYGYRLTPRQMTFAEWLNHATQRNYSDCAVLKGEPVSPLEKKAATLREKDEVSKAMKDSFAYCAETLKGMDDQKAISSPAMSNAFLHLVVHNNEIYGNVVGYYGRQGLCRHPRRRAKRPKGRNEDFHVIPHGEKAWTQSDRPGGLSHAGHPDGKRGRTPT